MDSRPQALAARAKDLVGDRIDERDIRTQSLAYHAVYRVHVFGDGRENPRQIVGG
jgi:hypothetical protein